MDNILFIILLVVCTVTHVIRSIYEILKHKKIIIANKLTFVITFTNMFVLWASWFLLCANDSYTIGLAGFIRYLGLLICIAGFAIFLIGLFTIKSLESYDGDLITKGIYSKIRHPMYSGFICWLIGAPFFFGALFSFFLSILFIANILFWRYLEEKELADRFSSYKDYKKKTIF
jgi:protein-S-isoprenylcysteine O-methyltransferase Ste14